MPHGLYGVFDGHGGCDAAVYSAAHLHQYLIQNPLYPTDPESALKHAFHITDTNFLKKCKKEVSIYFLSIFYSWKIYDFRIAKNIIVFGLFLHYWYSYCICSGLCLILTCNVGGSRHKCVKSLLSAA